MFVKFELFRLQCLFLDGRSVFLVQHPRWRLWCFDVIFDVARTRSQLIRHLKHVGSTVSYWNKRVSHLNCLIADIKAISSDTHQLQCIKLYQFKLEKSNRSSDLVVID